MVPIRERTEGAIIEWRSPAQTRNLLPKLVSGETRVQETERLVEAVA